MKSNGMLNVNINGNKKLVNTDSVRFMIWNLPAQVTCPFATEHCKAACYAKKAERVYPSVLPSRTVNFEDSKRDDFVDRMIQTIAKLLNGKAYEGKFCYFRIHESGDFYNKEYTEKWLKIVRWFDRHGWNYRIKFLAYTKSVQYFKSEAIPDNMIIRFSVWDDTNSKDILLAKMLNFPIYTAVDKFTEDFSEEMRCNCEDCANCGKCYSNAAYIACEIH